MDHASQTTTDESFSNHFRVNIYRNIHKGVRAVMCDTVMKAAALDLEDADEVAQVLAQAKELAVFCADHLRHENEYVHPAMEARQPGSATNTAGDHVHHIEAIEKVIWLANAVEQCAGKEQVAALHELHHGLTLFVADNFEHMHFEETHNHGVLSANYSDEEIMAIEHALVASLSPDEFAMCMRWMMIGMNPGERAELLGGIRANAPAPVFEMVLEIARAALDSRSRSKLEHALGLNERLAA